jgi:hypothetical protein
MVSPQRKIEKPAKEYLSLASLYSCHLMNGEVTFMNGNEAILQE